MHSTICLAASYDIFAIYSFVPLIQIQIQIQNTPVEKDEASVDLEIVKKHNSTF